MNKGEERVRLDHLVKGQVGSTEKVRTMRVGSLHSTFVSGVDDEGNQYVMYDPAIVGPPRPVAQR